VIATSTDKPTGLTNEQLLADDYHADPAIGASMIEDFYRSRRLFEGRYVTKKIPPKKRTAAMELGTLVHMRVLEPTRYGAEVIVASADAPDRRSRNYWADLEEQNEGKHIITHATGCEVEAIAESVLSKRWARRLLASDGQPEFSIFWTDQETGLNLKCRVDWFAGICLDLKTTADPSPANYARTLVNLGYHRKLAHYCAGISAYTGEDATLLHIAAGTEPPYACGAYEIDDRDMWDHRTPSLGQKQWRQILRDLAECYATNDWSDPFEREIVSLRLPQFAFSESQWR